MSGYARCFRNFTTASQCHKIINILNNDINAGGVVPVFKYGPIYRDKIAIRDINGTFSYRDIYNSARNLSHQITNKLNGNVQKTIAYLCPGDSSHIITQWAIWMSGNIAVPLCPDHPPPTIEYYLQDSGSSLIICDKNLIQNIPNSDQNKQITLILPTFSNTKDDIEGLEEFPNGQFYAKSDGLIMYTSGTTSKPKGVVYGFKQIAAQVKSLHTAWQYKDNDVMLHALPLHHVHGQINSVAASLTAGAKLRMLMKFDASLAWKYLLGMNKNTDCKVTVFMGVPTMYSKLINEYDKVFMNNSRQKEYIKNFLSIKLRLMISGSAPLPSPVFERWEEISGHRLLERYGMTEIGMALSNPYEPMSERTPRFVGTTLPGVSVRICSNETSEPLITLETEAPSTNITISKNQTSENKNLFKDELDEEPVNLKCKVTYGENKYKSTNISGELQVRGPGVFQKYWNRPEQTKSEFTEDGWFKTGDTGAFENGMVKILGRTSSDIIKSGGYKISALEVETLILGHPSVIDIAVIGLPDLTWGEKVAAVIELKEKITLNDLQNWCLEYIPRYQIPTELFVVDKIPRNAMGKINKTELQKTMLKQSMRT